MDQKPTEWYYPHGMVHHFHEHWSLPEQTGLGRMYDLCLWSDHSQRWWKRDSYQPKAIMMTLIQADAELATIAWKDLANDSAPLDGRLSRFEYYCSELLQIHRQKHLRSVEVHHHQDASMMSLYLSGLNPDKYALYPGLDIFSRFCKAIGSQDIPLVDDLVRYMKVVTIVHTFLRKNPGYEKLVMQRTSERHKVPCIPLLIAYEVIHFEGNPQKPLDYGF